MDALDRMRKTYKVSPSLNYATVSAAVSKVRTPQPLVEIIIGMVDAAVEGDDYLQARKLMGVALRASYRKKDLYRQVSDRNKSIGELNLAFSRMKPHLAKLKSNPDDPTANERVGSFYCFYKENWAKGLPMLVKVVVENDPLASAAEVELRNPEKPVRQVELGDFWWKISDKQKGTAQVNIRKHAVLWYKKALPTLSGLEKVRVEKRVAHNSKRSERPKKQRTLSKRDFASIIVKAGYVKIGQLCNGENALSNRGYLKWADIPTTLTRLPVTQYGVKRPQAITKIEARSSGAVLIIGWMKVTRDKQELVPEKLLEVTMLFPADGSRCKVPVYVVDIEKGDAIFLQRTGGRCGPFVAGRIVGHLSQAQFIDK